MDDQQNRRAESGLHAGTEPGNDSEGGDAGRVHGRRFWTPAEDAAVTALYPVESAQAIADKLGRGVRAIYMRANLLKLSKPDGWAAQCTRERWQQGRHENSRKAQFKPGQSAWNRGKPAKGWNPNIANCQATQFKKGHLGGAAAEKIQPIGALRIAGGQLQKKINNDPKFMRRWVPVSRLVWEAANGPVPAGHVVVFKPGKATTEEAAITLGKLELISRAENMRRNSYHTRYPKEVAQLIQLRGALNRKINKRIKA